MKQNKLSELTLEELQEKEKKMKGAVIGLGIVMAMACFALFYLAVKNRNYSLITVGIGSSITLLPTFMALNQISNEIKSRNSKKD